jgi:hypothetical protein
MYWSRGDQHRGERIRRHEHARRAEARTGARADGAARRAADPAFDRLTSLAATTLGAPVSLVSLVEAKRQFFASTYGLAEPWATRRETPLSHSFCQHVVHSRDAVIVTDARTDPLVAGNLAIPRSG